MLLAARAFAIWLLLITAEVVHGIVRTLVLTPAVGDFRARQIGVFTGSLLILLITWEDCCHSASRSWRSRR